MGDSNDQASVQRGRLVEYAEFIEDQVARARVRIKSNDMFRAMLWIFTATLGVLFLEVVLDHLVELPLAARRGILFGGLGLGLLYAWLKIARPMLKRVNTLYAAKSIESTDAHFKNSLINYLQIREDADKVAPSVLAQIEARAVADLSRVNVDDVVDQSPLARLSYALAAIIVGFCLYSWITPKSIWDSARRALLADVQRPTNTRFVNISPGDDKEAPKVITGLPVTFSVETLGRQPEAVTLFTSRDGGKTFAEAAMAQGRSFADPWSATIEKVPGELLYYMAGGDGRTRTYRLDVLPVAIVEKVSLDYEFPEYTQVPKREAIEEGNIEALQGTRVTLTATTNQPARSGHLDFGPRPPVQLLPVPGEPKKLKGTFLVEADGQYAVKFNTMDGQANPDPVLYDIRVVKDLSPTARFIRPENPALRPANARVPLVVEASDDFGLKELKLHVHKNGEILQKAVDVIDPKAKEAPKQVQQTVSLDLEPLSLKAGDKIQYWVTLRDNCDLQPNKFETPKQTIEIQDPVSEPQREQLAQNEMAQAREETGQQQPMGEQGEGSQSEDQKNNSGQQQQNKQQKPGEESEKQGNDQKKQGSQKGQQGNQSESAAPNENAKEGGSESKGQQQQSKSAAKNQQNKNGQKGQAGQNQQQGEKNRDSENQPGGESSTGNQPDSKQSPMNPNGQPQEKQNKGGEAGKQGAQQKNQAGQKGQDPGNEGQPGEKGEAGDQPKQAGEKGQPKPGQEYQPMPGEETGAEPGQKGEKSQNKAGGSEKNQAGQKGENSENKESGANKNQPGEPGQKAGQEGSKHGEEPKAAGSENQKGEKSPQNGNQAGETGQKGENQGRPQGAGEPKPGEQPEQEGGNQKPEPITQADRDKLNKLREALGMKSKTPQEAGEKGQEKAGDGEKGQSGEASNEKSQAGEKGTPGDKGQANEKGEQGDKGQAGQKGETGKNSGQDGEKGESGEKGKAGDKSKQDGEKGQQGKGESGQKPGGEQSKQAGEKGQGAEQSKQAGEKGLNGEKGQSGEQSKQAGEKGQGGEQSKQAGEKGQQPSQEGKGESGEKPGGEQSKQGGDQPKEGGQPGGEQSKPGGDDSKGEKGKSEKEGQEKGKPGALPKGVPNSGGMREGNETPEKHEDTTTASPRAVEPEQASGENLTTQQKADQRLLKRLREMVDKNEINKDLEQATGLSREEIDQFVRKFEAPAQGPRNPNDEGGTTEVSSRGGNQDENRKVSLPENLPGGQVTSRNNRSAGMTPEDGVQGNLEGARSRVPSALRSRFEAYQKGLSRAGGRAVGAFVPGQGGPSSNIGAKAESGSDR